MVRRTIRVHCGAGRPRALTQVPGAMRLDVPNMSYCPQCHASFAVNAATCGACGAVFARAGLRSIDEDRHVAATRPRPTQVAIVLLYAALLPNLALSLLLDVAPRSAQALASSLLLAAFSAFLIHKIAQGRNWARSSYLIVFIFSCLNVPALFAIVASGTATRRAMGAIDLVFSLAELVALIALFTSPSNDWFRQGAPADAPEARAARQRISG